MPDGRAELELALKTAEAELAKVVRVEELIRDVEEAAERLNKQDVDIDPEGFRQAQKELEETVRAARKAERALGRLEDEAKKRGPGFAASFKEMKGAVEGLLAALVVDRLIDFGRELGRIAGEAVQASIDVGRLRNSLEAIEGVDADETLARISQRAQDLGIDVGELRERTASFIQSATRLGLTVSESITVIEGLSTAAVGAGRDTGEFSRAIVQLEQALSKGRFEAQDFKTILEVYPGALAALAGALGKTTEETQELVSKGLLPAKEIAIILAGELPKLFGDQLQKNARDFGSDIQRIRNELTELQEVVGRGVTPEFREWLEILGLIGREAPEDLGLIGSAIRKLNDFLQEFVQQWVDRWTVAGLAIEKFALDSAKRLLDFQRFLANLGADLLPGIEESLERSTALLEQWEKAARERAEGFARSLRERGEAAGKADEEATARLRAEQEERQAAADAAARRALVALQAKLDAEESLELKSYKRRKDAFDKFFEDTSGESSVGVSVGGTEEATSRLSRIAELQRTIEELSPKQLTGITQEELDRLGAAQRELMQLRNAVTELGGLPAVGSSLDPALVGDFTDRARSKLDELAQAILVNGDRVADLRLAIARLSSQETLSEKQQKALKGFREELASTETAFDRLGSSGQQNVALLASELQSLVERGGVQEFELDRVLGELGEALERTVGPSQSAAGAIADYANRQDEAKRAADSLASGTDEAGAAIQRLVDDAGNVSFTNLDEEARGAAEGVRIFRGAGEEGRDVIDGFGKGAEKAASEVKVLEGAGEGGATSITNLAEASEKAEEPVRKVGEAGKALGEAATAAEPPLTKIDQAVKGLAADGPGAAEAAGAIGSNLSENQAGLESASSALSGVAESVPTIATGFGELRESLPAVLQTLKDAVEAGDVASFTTLLSDLAAKLKESQEGVGALATGLESVLKVAQERSEVEGLKETLSGLEETSKGLGEVADALERIAKALDDTKTNADGIKGKFDEVKGAVERLVTFIDTDAIPGLGRLEEALESINTALETSKGNFDSWAASAEEAIGRVSGKLGAIEGQIDRINAKLNELERRSDEVLGGNGGGGGGLPGSPLAGQRGPVQPGSRAGLPRE